MYFGNLKTQMICHRMQYFIILNWETISFFHYVLHIVFLPILGIWPDPQNWECFMSFYKNLGKL